MPHTLLTPEQIDLLLPMLGASLLLNMALAAALISRSIYRRLLQTIDTWRIGLRLWLQPIRRERTPGR